MPFFVTAIFLSLVASSFVPLMATPTYLEVLPDIPIAEGLSLEDDSETILDVPEGKIVEVTTFGPLDVKDVQKFYKDSLAALGWKSSSAEPWVYKRGDEILELSFEDGDEDLQVKFLLKPRAASKSPH